METARCKAFLSAAAKGSITAASQELGYTASGVSQLIMALEDDLGVKLLERHKKGVRLTSEGGLMLPYLREMVIAEKNVYEQASDILGVAAGTVSIASYPSMATYWLPKVIRRFREDHPNVEIRLMEGIKQEMMGWILNGDADMGFMSVDETDRFDWLPLAEDRMVAVLPDSHEFAKSSAYPLNRCEKEDFIMPALGHDADVEELLEDEGIRPDIRFTTMENPVMLSMIENGLGMSIMNELCTEMWKGRVTVIPLDPPRSVTFGIATEKKRHLSPAAKAFIGYAVRMLTRKEGV